MSLQNPAKVMVPIHCTRQTSSSSTRSLPNLPAPDIPRSSSPNLWIHTSPPGSPSSTLTLFPPSDLSPSYAPCLSQNPVFYKPKQYQPALFPPKSQNLDFSVSSLHLKMMQDQASSFPSSSLPSSSERSSSSALQLEIKDGMESDEEIRRVPELGSEGAGPSISGREGGLDRVQATPGGGQKKRGRSPADKENKRLKRLLRNRVSAQQARERKKAYLSELEVKVKDLEKKNSELDERLSTLQNENQMLRHILKNTTVNRRGSSSANVDV